jgi:Icc-related predicted phosphoesterase
VTHHIAFEWPDPAPFRDRGGAAIRLLVVSDAVDPTLTDVRNRQVLSPIDLIVGCGDLDCSDLAFIADGLNSPLIYVNGNHDSGERFSAGASYCPEPIRSTAVQHRTGLAIAGLTWPGARGERAARSERSAWNQALSLAVRRLGKREPLIVISHVPPFGAGDAPDGGYHRGFRGYRWLMDRLAPPLWLHGHTPLAATSDWRVEVGRTTLVNATGAVVVELLPPKASSR